MTVKTEKNTSAAGSRDVTTERVFNLFLEVEGETITQLAAVVHEIGGSDNEKLTFLQRQVEADIPTAKRYPVPSRYLVIENGVPSRGGLSHKTYQVLSLMNKHLGVFHEIFEEHGGPDAPLFCITPIRNGKPCHGGIQRF